jgi:hypothetical protein
MSRVSSLACWQFQDLHLSSNHFSFAGWSSYLLVLIKEPPFILTIQPAFLLFRRGQRRHALRCRMDEISTKKRRVYARPVRKKTNPLSSSLKFSDPAARLEGSATKRNWGPETNLKPRPYIRYMKSEKRPLPGSISSKINYAKFQDCQTGCGSPLFMECKNCIIFFWVSTFLNNLRPGPHWAIQGGSNTSNPPQKYSWEGRRGQERHDRVFINDTVEGQRTEYKHKPHKNSLSNIE